MQGSFSNEAVELYSRLVNSRHEKNFSEAEVHDFTRCLRPDGTSFGTAGKCTSPNRPAPPSKTANPQAEKLEKEAEDLMSGGRRNSLAIQDIARKLRERAKVLRGA